MRVTRAILTTLAALGCTTSGSKGVDTDTDTDGPSDTFDSGDSGCLDSCCGFTPEQYTSSFDEVVLFEDGTVRPADVEAEGEPADPDTSTGCEAACAVVAGLYDSIDDCVLTPLGDTDVGLDSDWVVDTDRTTPTPYQLQCSVTATTQCEGRHHAVLAGRAEGHGSTPVGAWLARAASAEAGSVHAFRALAGELAALGAPAALVEACSAAAADEVRHARDTARLARRRGGEISLTPRLPLAPRSLRAIAIENAVEGCVHETFAAAVAGWQAGHAEDPEVRALADAILPDELRHAELAHALHAWAMSVLPPADADAVRAAHEEAWDRLLCEGTPIDLSDAAARQLGWPDAETVAHLALGIRAGVGHA